MKVLNRYLLKLFITLIIISLLTPYAKAAIEDFKANMTFEFKYSIPHFESYLR